jgi:hypothetical protein
VVPGDALCGSCTSRIPSCWINLSSGTVASTLALLGSRGASGGSGLQPGSPFANYCMGNPILPLEDPKVGKLGTLARTRDGWSVAPGAAAVFGGYFPKRAAAARPRLPNSRLRSRSNAADFVIASRGSNGSARPRILPVPGMNCATPCARAWLTASGLKRLSCQMSLVKNSAGRSFAAAAAGAPRRCSGAAPPAKRRAPPENLAALLAPARYPRQKLT